jgi:DNA-binding CsgD family transcriptional regulator
MNKKSSLSLSLNDYNETVEKIYQASMDANLWSKTLEKIATVLQAEQGILRAINRDTLDILQTHRYNKDPCWDGPYKEYFKNIDPWLKLFLEASDTFYTCTNHLISDKDYKCTELHRDFVMPQNIHYGIGGLIKYSPGHDAFIVFHRDRNKTGFEQDKVETIRLLGTHIQQALLVGEKTRQLDFENKLLLDVFDQISYPVLLVSPIGEIMFINQQAEDLITLISHLSIKSNRLKLLNSQDNESLYKLIFHATGSFVKHSTRQGGAMNSLNTEGQSRLYILVNPISPDLVNISSSMMNCAMVILDSDQMRNKFPCELLKGLYGLTPAEARLVEGLCMGLSLEQIAKQFSLSRNTLKSQLRSCFHKIDVDRQQDIVNIVSSGPLGLIKTTS